MKKATILIAILLLSLVVIPTAMAFQQLVKTPHVVSAESYVEVDTALCGGNAQTCGPGSGGGGEGTI